MSRRAQLYLLDEPIAGVDPAARDYILHTILSNYNHDGTVIISTHLISDVEKVLDEVIFLKNGQLVCYDTVDRIRETQGKSVDALFREIFRTIPVQATWDEVRTACRNAGIPVGVTALSDKAKDIRSVNLSQMAVVIGSEGQGVRKEILESADAQLIIPMNPRCESLNAAVAATIVAWQMTDR